MLLNFDTELDRQGTSRVVQVQQTATVERPKARTSVERGYLIKSEWEWSDLRDYVVYEIEERFGPFPRESAKEVGIFKAFMKRWGADAQAIAKYAFEVENGRWRGAPISIYRFCQNSDPYFAVPIMERIQAKA